MFIMLAIIQAPNLFLSNPWHVGNNTKTKKEQADNLGRRPRKIRTEPYQTKQTSRRAKRPLASVPSLPTEPKLKPRGAASGTWGRTARPLEVVNMEVHRPL